MKEATPRAIHRREYQVPPFLIDKVDLAFDLDEQDTRVRSRLEVRRNPEAPPAGDLRLDGQDLQLVQLRLDGALIDRATLQIEDEALVVPGVPDKFVLEVETVCHPAANKSLEGLYVSSGNFCTQCEAEGFRKITYFLDRPDVMTRFTTRIEGDKQRHPVLLSNGNLVESGDLEGGRHYALWDDPFKKPSYLFALVAGRLVRKAGAFTTMSGREVNIHIYVEPQNLDKTDHCLTSVQKAMKWDEEVFGREYDLDLFQIVAVGDFNMGAMENKGLNVFNTKFVLARPETATDQDFLAIEAVVGHEYFHNWSGNRVTCRDWFQLSLKEGFTVFRDQEFSSDMGSRAVKRISDVQRLRAAQFPEDAGPTAHPVRPDSYVEINNFYTVTIYEKGAEVVRMLHTLLGAEAFRRGTDLYFARHDGQAVTCDDFVACMEEVSGRDLTQFRLWYSQAGTPRVEVQGRWDAKDARYTLTFKQTVPATPGQPEKSPMHIPVRMGLLGADGRDVPLRLGTMDGPDDDGHAPTERLLELTRPEQSFTFVGLAARPVPSLFRGFSAPVRLEEVDRKEQDLIFRMAHDSDPVAKWDAGQVLQTGILLDAVRAFQDGKGPTVPHAFLDAFGTALQREDADPALLALALALPSETVLAEEITPVDPDAIHQARQWLKRTIASAHRDLLQARYDACGDDGPYRLDPDAVGCRLLRNLCLGYLMSLAPDGDGGLAEAQLTSATHMTDTLAALVHLTHVEGPARERALAAFYARWKDDPLVLDKWFSIQAMSQRQAVLDEVELLTHHEAFDLENPNKVRALLGAFASTNQVRFHDASGRGYAFLADRVLELDRFNASVAARLLMPLTRWRRFDVGRAEKMRAELERVLGREGVSKDVYEIASKALA